MTTDARPLEAATSLRPGGHVLIVDPDRDIAELVQAILTDEGYAVSCLYEDHGDLLQAAVGRLEPDCVLLDGSGPDRYVEAWEEARWLNSRPRPVPVVLFTTNHRDAAQARARDAEPGADVAFSDVVPKPFNLDELLDAVASSVGRSVPFDGSPEADAARTATLVARLRARGADELHASSRREWVTFHTPSGRVVQLYWWQARGVYYCGTYDETGATMEPRGTFADLDAASECALAL